MSDVVPRRRFSTRQVETVLLLVDAALEELRAGGYEGLTVRNVAKRAGVAPATAYLYFSSKDHLVTEVFWRRLQSLPDPAIDRRHAVSRRIGATLEDLTGFVGAEPALAQACTVSMLGSDPDVVRLRLTIGSELHRRVALAAGDELAEEALEAVDLLVTGALVNAGMGHVRYEDLGEILAGATDLVVNGALR